MVHQAHIDHPAAWKGSDFAGKADIAFDLGRAHIAAFDEALAAVNSRGLALQDITRDDFPLVPIEGDVAAIRREVLDGRGIVVLGGFPVERYGAADVERIYWGLGAHLGEAVSQSKMGDRMGHVTDVSGRDPRERGYRSSKELDLHTDSDNIVGLLCVRDARSGGESRLASALAIHNEMLAAHPDLLAPLYRGFRYHWRGEEPPGEPSVTDYRVPVFSESDGVVSVCYLRAFIDMAAKALDQPLSDDERAALDCFEAIANRDDVVFTFTLAPGEVLLFNNYTVLHSRTAFEDHGDEATRRLLLRLWLKAPGARPLAEPVRRYYGHDGIAPAAAGDTLYTGDALIEDAG